LAASQPSVSVPLDPASQAGGEAAHGWTGERQPSRARRKAPSLAARLRRDWVLLLLMLPGVLYFAVFLYLPLLGYIIAFENYRPFLGYFNSEFVGLANFQNLANDPSFWNALRNTLVISLLQIFLYFPAPIALALLLSSVVSTRARRFIQSVVYLPHFISWVIIVSLFQQLFGGAGVLASVMREFDMPTMNLMSDPDFFKWMVTAQLIWKDCGWGTIIYLAALLSIDASLYEAAAVDGAGRWQRLWHVTLPGLVGITILLLILRMGAILTVGFEQILLQRDAVGPGAGEVLDTYVYYYGIGGGQWGITAAAGLIKGIVGTLLVIGANRLAHAFGQEGAFR
jgi:putative aldouronate transport system permease protein